jgi:hypothetical protein
VLRGNTQSDGKLLSVFETHTEVIRKGKANKPNEFGKLVVIQEAENQIVTHYQVCEQRPADSTFLEGCLKQHVEQFGHGDWPPSCLQTYGIWAGHKTPQTRQRRTRTFCRAAPRRVREERSRLKSTSHRFESYLGSQSLLFQISSV